MTRIFYDTTGTEVDMDKASALLDSKGLAIRWTPIDSPGMETRLLGPAKERFEVELYRRESRVLVARVEADAGRQIAAAKGLLDRVERGEFDRWR